MPLKLKAFIFVIVIIQITCAMATYSVPVKGFKVRILTDALAMYTVYNNYSLGCMTSLMEKLERDNKFLSTEAKFVFCDFANHVVLFFTYSLVEPYKSM